jgi:hypothetical protein
MRVLWFRKKVCFCQRFISPVGVRFGDPKRSTPGSLTGSIDSGQAFVVRVLMRLPIILLVALVAATIAQVVHFYPHLPDVVVSHWGSGGKSDGWLNRVTFFGALAISELGTTGFFVAMAFAFPYIPKRWWNLPYKDYWLAPQRRSSTVRYVQIQMLWAAVIIETAMLLIWQSTINANLKTELHWPADFWWTLIVTAVIFVVWIVRLTRYFNSVPSAAMIHRK